MAKHAAGQHVGPFNTELEDAARIASRYILMIPPYRHGAHTQEVTAAGAKRMADDRANLRTTPARQPLTCGCA